MSVQTLPETEEEIRGEVILKKEEKCFKEKMAKEFTMAEMEDKSLIQKSLPINKGIFVVFNH